MALSECFTKKSKRGGPDSGCVPPLLHDNQRREGNHGRMAGDRQNVDRHLRAGRAANRKNAAPDRGVLLPGDRAACLRQARAGAAQPVRPGVLLSLSNTVQNAIIGNDNSLSGGLIGALTLLAINYLV